jgi:ribosomal protein S18 acetylase RimI-like enzyme
MAALIHSNVAPPVVPLTPADVSRLRISWRARLSVDEIQRALLLAPGRSVWSPATDEYAVAMPWRNRLDVIQITEVAAIRHPEAMIRGVAEAARAHGAVMAVLVEIDEKRPASFYERVRFEHLERVVTFHIDRRHAPNIERPSSMRFVRANPSDPRVLQSLMAIDHQAFPWLWRNSELEFQTYGLTPGVDIYLGLEDDRPVSYIGFTTFPGWGHVDRIAVLPDLQGSGYGLHTLAFAVDAMGNRGVRRIGLSTQSTNEQSQRLYRRYGFERSTDNDYDLWGDATRRAPGDPIIPPASH